jgi:hypothetical protein
MACPSLRMKALRRSSEYPAVFYIQSLSAANKFFVSVSQAACPHINPDGSTVVYGLAGGMYFVTILRRCSRGA